MLGEQEESAAPKEELMATGELAKHLKNDAISREK